MASANAHHMRVHRLVLGPPDPKYSADLTDMADFAWMPQYGCNYATYKLNNERKMSPFD